MMTKSDISKLSPKRLRAAYDAVCNEYLQRLCDMWEMHCDFYWVANIPGTTAEVGDYLLGMEEIVTLVDNAIDLDTFDEWYWQ